MLKKFNNLFKIFLCNFVVLIVFFFLIEYTIYFFAASEYEKTYRKVLKFFPTPTFVSSYKQNYTEHSYQRFNNRNDFYLRSPSINPLNTKCPIFIFGCSFAHGTKFLSDDQTIGFKLSKNTNRDVYNFGFPACGIQHMLYFIRNFIPRKIQNNIVPEYAIYFYIPNHIFRLRTNIHPTLFSNGMSLKYKIKNGDLVLEKPFCDYMYKLFIVKFILSISDFINKCDSKKEAELNFLLLNSLFLESKKALEKKYPNIKFVILRYQIENDDDHRELPYMWDALKNQGFTIINSSDLIGRKYKYNSEDTTLDYYHPSEYAWDLLVTPLIKELNL